jgi:dihydroorotate dehydrogenase
VAGLSFKNPIGIAAGFDKNGEVPMQMLAQGCGFTEVGTTTPRPQAGNPKPRVFRLVEDEALINRLGFNNEGHDAMARRLEALPAKGGARASSASTSVPTRMPRIASPTM